MIILYNIVLILLTIIFIPLIIIAFIIQPKFRAGFFEKIGFYSFKINKRNNTTIFHAVSVGETNAIKDLVTEYRKKHPDEIIVITTTTKTGQEIAQKVFKNIADKITYFPYDFFFSVLSFFNTFKPQKIIIAETEIWPCFISIAKLKGINVYCVNGRISPHSYNGYKKIKLFLSPILNKYTKIFMQSNDDAERIIDIGAKDDKVEVMGNLKFDITPNLTTNEIQKFENELKTINYRVLIAASTHNPEDSIVLNAFKELKKEYTDSKLLIAPRHPQRYEEVVKLLDESGLKWGKRSKNDNFIDNEIILLDTMGELSKLFSICYVAYIGGSFSGTGGHNPLEATIWNKPVISGPSTFNFKDVYKILTDKKCAKIVNDETELINSLTNLYNNQNEYSEFCKNAKSVFDENKGAISYVLERI